MERNASFSQILHVLAATDTLLPRPEQGEPLSFAAWAAQAPASLDPDPRPAVLVAAYRAVEEAQSKYLNQTI